MQKQLLRACAVVLLWTIGPHISGFPTPGIHALAGEAEYAIVLRPAALVSESVVRIHDLATVSGPKDSVIQKLGNLDIDDAPLAGQALKVPASQVRFRLRLLGIPDDMIAIRGTETVVARRIDRTPQPQPATLDESQPQARQIAEIRARLLEQIEQLAKRQPVPTVVETTQPQIQQVSASVVAETLIAAKPPTPEERVAQAARESILKRLPWDGTDVEITTTHVGIQPSTRRLAQTGELRAELRSAWPPLGRVQIVVQASGPTETAEIPVILNVQYFQNVIVSAGVIPQGQKVRQEDIYIDRREVRDLANFLTRTSDVVGLQATRPIGPLQVLHPGDVSVGTNINIPGPPVVRTGQSVRLKASGGPLAISVAAEAQQDGRVGDVIRLKNADSGKIVTGTVTADGNVEVSF